MSSAPRDEEKGPRRLWLALLAALGLAGATVALVRPGSTSHEETPLAAAKPAPASTQAAKIDAAPPPDPATGDSLLDDHAADDDTDEAHTDPNDRPDDPSDEAPTPRPGPDRADILAGLAPVEPRIVRCPVTAPLAGALHLAVSASGRVGGVTLSGALASDPVVAECLTRAVRAATFRHVSRSFSLSWPVALHPPADEARLDQPPSGTSKR